MKSRGIFYMIKRDTKQDITHRRDEFTSRRWALLYCIRFCYSLFIMSKKHYCSTPTVSLSYENPQHYQRSEQSGTFPSTVNATKAYIHLFKRRICSGSQPQGRNLPQFTAAAKTCIAPSLNSDRFTILRKSATLSKVGICSGSQPQGRNLPRPTGAYSWSAKL